MAKRKDLLDVKPTIEWNGKPNRKYFLKHLIQKYDYKSMIEVGVRDGRTTFYLLDNIPDLIIYGIDRDVSFATQEKISKYKNRLIPIQGHSHLVANKLPDVDLVFIDADHSYNGCKGDILAYRGKVKSTGTLSGHDIDYPGVNQAVNELLKEYEIGPNNVWFISPDGA